MEQALSDEPRVVEDIIEEIRETPTFGPASDHDACQYWANIARELANAIELEQVGRGHVPRFGIRLAYCYVNDNNGKGWPTSKAAEDQLSAWCLGWRRLWLRDVAPLLRRGCDRDRHRSS